MNFQIISMDVINESMMGNKEFVKQLVDMYIIQSPADFNDLQNAILSGDHIKIREKAHHIKPTMKYIGAMNLLDDFQLLENLAKEEASLEKINSHFADIKPKFSLMLDELKMIQ